MYIKSSDEYCYTKPELFHRLADEPRKVGNERRIPFEISAVPFKSEENLEMLEKRTAELKAKKNAHEHELIEKH